MSKRQKILGKGVTSRGSTLPLSLASKHLTDSTMPSKLSSLNPKQFVASDIWRGASEKRKNMAVVGTTIDGISIHIAFGDQWLNGQLLPPCFYATKPPGNAVIALPTLEVLDTTLSQSQLDEVLAWARIREANLSGAWSLINQGQAVGRIR